jgi:hypothetical protein
LSNRRGVLNRPGVCTPPPPPPPVNALYEWSEPDWRLVTGGAEAVLWLICTDRVSPLTPLSDWSQSGNYSLCYLDKAYYPPDGIHVTARVSASVDVLALHLTYTGPDAPRATYSAFLPNPSFTS